MIFRSLSLYVCALFAISFFFPQLTHAQNFQTQSRHCNNPDASVALRIEACGWLIQSGQLPDKGYGIVYRLRGMAYIDGEDYDLAVADLTQAIAHDPKRVSNYLDRAYAHSFRNYNGLAMDDYNQAIAIDPYNAEAYFYRAGLFIDKKQVDLAILDYRAAVRLDPDDAYGLNSLAWLLAVNPDKAERRGAEAIIFAQRALDVNPDDYEIWDTLAAAYVEDGQGDKALDAYLKAQEIGGQDRIEMDQIWLKENGYYFGQTDGAGGEETIKSLKECIAASCQMHSELW
ncbi:tetratricopeptide repeat protein [Kiloniella litopenaei]|uniref:tetratricopeptide repeat protein n=1 Tax=Kiloniella litopenaei TaxID=1549748 RepID=UPI003BAA11F3